MAATEETGTEQQKLVADRLAQARARLAARITDSNRDDERLPADLAWADYKALLTSNE